MRNKDKKRINRAIEDFKITLKNKEELFNKYAREDFGEYVKELEKEYNCEIEPTSWNIKFKK